MIPVVGILTHCVTKHNVMGNKMDDFQQRAIMLGNVRYFELFVKISIINLNFSPRIVSYVLQLLDGSLYM